MTGEELARIGRTSRIPVALLTFGTFVAPPVLGGLVGNLVSEGLGAVLGIVSFVGLLGFLVLAIATAAPALRALGPAAMAGDERAVAPPARRVLRFVFRGDMRAAALHGLALLAESRAEIGAAAELFARAEKQIPFGMGLSDNARVRALACGHLALDLALLGRAAEARQALARAHQALATGPSAWDGLAAAGTLFGVMRSIEPGRDPRAVAALAGLALAHLEGANREALDLAMRERWLLDSGLLPRERRLAYGLELRARAALEGGGAMRVAAPAPDGTAEEAWAEAALGRRESTR